jgi:hypothetical protein
MEKQPNSRMCFVCGIENPIGLHLAFYTDDEGRCIARFRPKPEHQGYPGQLHGGIMSTLLRQAMGRVGWLLARLGRIVIPEQGDLEDGAGVFGCVLVGLAHHP